MRLTVIDATGATDSVRGAAAVTGHWRVIDASASPRTPAFPYCPSDACKTGAGMAVTAENRVGQVRPARGLMGSSISRRARMRARCRARRRGAAEHPAGLLRDPADRSRRGAVRAGHQADDRERRLSSTSASRNDGRYKKPVGIYWLQAGVVKTAQALGMREALTTIWLYRIPSLLGAVGAVLLTYWAALAFLSRRAARARRADDGDLHPAQRRGPDRQDRCLLLLDRGCRHGRDGARLSARARAAARGAAAWTVPAIFWTALAARRAAQGAGDPADRGP